MTCDCLNKKILTKIILQQLKCVFVIADLVSSADIFTLHFTDSTCADLTALQSSSASMQSLNEMKLVSQRSVDLHVIEKLFLNR